MKPLWRSFLLVCLSLLLVLAACGKGDDKGSKKESAMENKTEKSDVRGGTLKVGI